MTATPTDLRFPSPPAEGPEEFAQRQKFEEAAEAEIGFFKQIPDAIASEWIFGHLARGIHRASLEDDPNFPGIWGIPLEERNEIFKDLPDEQLNEFDNARSMAEVQLIRRQLDQLNIHRDRLARLGATGFLMRIGANVIDPANAALIFAEAALEPFLIGGKLAAAAKGTLAAPRITRYQAFARSAYFAAGTEAALETGRSLVDPEVGAADIAMVATFAGGIGGGVGVWMRHGLNKAYSRHLKELDADYFKRNGVELTEEGTAKFGDDVMDEAKNKVRDDVLDSMNPESAAQLKDADPELVVEVAARGGFADSTLNFRDKSDVEVEDAITVADSTISRLGRKKKLSASDESELKIAQDTKAGAEKVLAERAGTAVPPKDIDPEGSFEVGGVKFDNKKGIGSTPDNSDINRKGFVVMMRPSRFLGINTKRVDGPDTDETVAFLSEAIGRGDAIASPSMTVDATEDGLQTFLHEGRGRMRAILETVGDEPVPVQIFPSGKRASNFDSESLLGSRILADESLESDDFEIISELILGGKRHSAVPPRVADDATLINIQDDIDNFVDNPQQVTDMLDEADVALGGEAGSAIDGFVGHPPMSRDAEFGGVMQAADLEDAFSTAPTPKGIKIRSQLESAFSPVRERLKKILGKDTITLFRHQRKLDGTESPRSVLSFTSDPRFVTAAAGGSRLDTVVSSAESSAAWKSIRSDGEATVKGVTFRPDGDGGLDLFRGESHITGILDTESDFLSHIKFINDGIQDVRERSIANLSEVEVREIPIDDVVWATDRANQMEFIVRTDRLPPPSETLADMVAPKVADDVGGAFDPPTDVYVRNVADSDDAELLAEELARVTRKGDTAKIDLVQKRLDEVDPGRAAREQAAETTLTREQQYPMSRLTEGAGNAGSKTKGTPEYIAARLMDTVVSTMEDLRWGWDFIDNRPARISKADRKAGAGNSFERSGDITRQLDNAFSRMTFKERAELRDALQKRIGELSELDDKGTLDELQAFVDDIDANIRRGPSSLHEEQTLGQAIPPIKVAPKVADDVARGTVELGTIIDTSGLGIVNRTAFDAISPEHARLSQQLGHLTRDGTLSQADADLIRVIFSQSGDLSKVNPTLASVPSLRKIDGQEIVGEAFPPGPGGEMGLVHIKKGLAREATENGSAAHVLLHEIGHIAYANIDDAVIRSEIRGIYEAMVESGEWESLIRELASGGKRTPDEVEAVVRYFNNDPDEFFAEYFARSLMGRKIPTEHAALKPVMARMADWVKGMVARVAGRSASLPSELTTRLDNIIDTIGGFDVTIAQRVAKEEEAVRQAEVKSARAAKSYATRRLNKAFLNLYNGKAETLSPLFVRHFSKNIEAAKASGKTIKTGKDLREFVSEEALATFERESTIQSFKDEISGLKKSEKWWRDNGNNAEANEAVRRRAQLEDELDEFTNPKGSPDLASDIERNGINLSRSLSQNTGEFSDTPTLFGLKMPRWSIIHKVMSSTSSAVRLLGGHMGDNALLLKDGSKNFSASTWIVTETQKRMTDFYRTAIPQLSLWQKKQQMGGLRRALSQSDRDAFMEEVGHAVRRPQGTYKGADGLVDEHVHAVADVIREQQEELLALGVRYGVKGFEMIADNPQYLTRAFNTKKIHALVNEHGEEAIRLVIKGAMRSARDELDEVGMDELARGYLKIIMSLDEMNHVQKAIILAPDNTEDLVQALGEIGFDEAQLDAIRRVVGPDPEGGLLPRAKRRVDLDELYVDDATGISMEDLLENNAETLFNSYNRQMVGASAMSAVFRDFSERQGLKTPIETWEAMLAYLKRNGAQGHIEEPGTELALLDTMYRSNMGLRLDSGSVGSDALRRIRDAQVIRVFNQVGFSQVPEIGVVMSEVGWKHMAAQMPVFREIFQNAADGRLHFTNDLLEEMAQFLGHGMDYMLDQVVTNFDVDDAVGIATGAGRAERGLAAIGRSEKLRQGLAKGARATMRVSGFHAVDTGLNRMAWAGAMQKWYKLAKSGKMMSDKRMAAMGFHDDAGRARVKAIYKLINDHAETADGFFGKRVSKMNFAKWNIDDADAASDFLAAMQQWSRRVVQRNDIGAKAQWMTTSWGATLTQFRTFALSAWEKQLLFGMQQRDMETGMMMVYTTMIGGMAYIGQQYMQSIGLPEKERAEFLKERITYKRVGAASFYKAGWTSMLPPVADSAMGIAGFDPFFSFGRSSQLATGIVAGNPTVDFFNTAMRAARGAIAPLRPGYEFSQKDSDAWQKLSPYGNMALWKNFIDSLETRLPEDSNPETER